MFEILLNVIGFFVLLELFPDHTHKWNSYLVYIFAKTAENLTVFTSCVRKIHFIFFVYVPINIIAA